MNFLNLDYDLFNTIHSLSGQSRLLDFFGIFCAKYLIFVIGGIVLGWWLELHKTKPTFAWPIEGKKKWLIFGNFSMAALTAFFLNYVLGFLKFRERPYINLKVARLVNPMSEKSFPSDHAAVAFALALTVFFRNKKVGAVLLLLALLVGWGRIYTGVHYPIDVVGGILVGLAAAALMRWVVFRKARE
jgi:undecaprenyl-diphosphatase